MAFRRSKHHPIRKSDGGINRGYPLRKIVGTRDVEIMLVGGQPSGVFMKHEVLECGHAQRVRSDFIGETNASKRRCVQCPKDVE